jgi:flagellar basal body P-ring formation protein FlgA
MLEEIIRTGTVVLALGAAAAGAHGGEDPFPAFQANVAALVASQAQGANGARLQFTNPAVAAGAAQMYGPDAQLSLHSFDARACRFAVKVENAAAQLPPALLTGGCTLTARIPVAARDLRPGEALTGDAIVETEEALARIPANTVRDRAALAGQTPRQPLQAGRPIAAASLRTKPAIEKNQAVTLRFSAGGLELTVQGQAQADAALGEPVPVLNIRSKKIVDAVAAGPGLAEIRSPVPARIAAAN